MGFLSGVASAVSGKLLGGAIDYVGAKQQQSSAISAAREQMAFQKDMFKNRYKYQMEDMRRAGLNPILSYSQGPPSAPTGSRAEAIHTTSGLGRAVGESVNKATQSALQIATAKQAQAQVGNIVAQTDESRARAENLRSQTENIHPSQRSQLEEAAAKAHSGAALDRANEAIRKVELKTAWQKLEIAKKDAIIAELDAKMYQTSPGEIGRALQAFGVKPQDASGIARLLFQIFRGGRAR